MKLLNRPIAILLAASTQVFAHPYHSPQDASTIPERNIQERATPTVYLAGDSTMAKGGGGSETDGWGVFLPYSLSIPVVNNAIAGRSARSFTNEGRFTSLANSIKSGDIVVIEFGHNDGGSLATTDNGRTDCYGAGNEVCTSVTGATVYTYPKYLTDATNLILSKGGKVILSSPTPNNPWEGGSFSYSTPRFTSYAKSVATALGVGFVDHGQYVANIFKAKGASTVNSYFPKEHTHTSPEGAATVAKAFIKGVLCAGSATVLGSYTKNSTASVEGSCI